MKLFLACILLVSLAPGSPAGQTPQDSPASKQSDAGRQAAPLKPIHTEMLPYPEQALKKRIQGKIKLRIVVDAQGNVSDVKVLHGPKELVSTAVASVKKWQYEPPPSPPAVETVEVSYGFPRQCSGAASDSGAVATNARLLDRHGKLIAVPASDDYATPPYPEEERKAGAHGKMVLAVSIDPEGKVTRVRVIKSLSAGLDKSAIETVETWKFNPVDSGAKPPFEDLRLHILFVPVCNPNF